MRSAPPRPLRTADRHLWQIQPVVDFVGLLLIALILWLIYDLRRLFAPVFIALALAYLVEPLVEAMVSRIGVPRWGAALLFTIVLTVCMVLLVTWVGPLLTDQVTALSARAPDYIKTVDTRYHLQLANMSDHLARFAKGLQEKPVETLSPVLTGTGQAVSLLGRIVATTLEVLVSTLLVPIFFFLLVWHFGEVRSTIQRLVPGGRGAKVRRILYRMNEAVSGFIRGRLLIGIITATGLVVGWAWSDVPYSLLLGLISGALTIVPYLSLVGWPIALFLKYLDAVSSGGTPTWHDVVLWPSVVFIVVAFLEGWVLTPWIQSRTMEMSGLTVLLAVLVGGAIGGVLGLLLAIPFIACAKVLMEELWGSSRDERLEA
ncbi:AI-2E family transporter [Nitrospira sp. Nam74]